ncbi:MAG: quinate 5-dehydrogenase [Clostridia bacterium]|nr:quinate 5-dehydrogenase [Clostridia bacterium]
MKKVISISLGSPAGDVQACVELLGQRILIERIGTGGDLKKALGLLRELDGQVDVLGLGGINFAYGLGRRSYPLREANFLRRGVCRTPLVDGSAVKEHLERRAVAYLAEQGICHFKGCRALVVSVLDRFPLAEALAAEGARLTIGDAMFGLGLPIAFRSLAAFSLAGRLTLPLLRLLPIGFLYPLGEKQNRIRPRFGRYYQEADYIAGDFHFIYRHLPDRLDGQTVITGTVRPDDVEELRKRGAARLITLFPAWEGRFLGANLWEAALVAVLERNPGDLSGQEWDRLLEDLNWRPVVTEL